MSKSFRDLVEALNAKMRKKEQPMDGQVGGKPYAKGEEEFAKDMYPANDKVGGPNDRPSPGKGADDAVNARKMKQTAKAEPGVAGEKTTPKQGTSTTANSFGYKGSQTPPNRGDNRQGDIKPVKTSPSAVKAVAEGRAEDNLKKNLEKRMKRFQDIATKRGEISKKMGYKETSRKEGPGGTLTTGKYVKEDVVAQLRKIASGSSEGSVKFADGDTSNVSPDTAKRMLATHKKLSPENAKKFVTTINKSPEGFLKMMNFSNKHGDK